MIEKGPTIENKEQEPKSRVPTIDFIRHGSTAYNELLKPDFQFKPKAKGFQPDAEHLDLTEEGIKEIQETAKQLLDIIDRENEAIILITSPAPRAISSIILIEKILRENGTMVLNPQDIKKSRELEQMQFKEKGVIVQQWFDETAKYNKQLGPDGLPPDIFHQDLAARFDKKVDDVFTENYDQIDRRFLRFLRHMTNLNERLQDKTRQRIGQRRLRIICLTHGELPSRFLRRTFDDTTSLRRAQILEFQPSDQIEPDKPPQTKVVLYQKGSVEQKETNIPI